MHSLVPSANPQSESLTGGTARTLAAELSVATSCTVEVANLNGAGFDRFSLQQISSLSAERIPGKRGCLRAGRPDYRDANSLKIGARTVSMY